MANLVTALAPPHPAVRTAERFLAQSGIVSATGRVMLRGAFGNIMHVGYRSPKAPQPKQLLLLKLLLLCILGWVEFTPATALAAASIPMCSIFGECVEAPPPESPPTGGEVRAKRQGLFDQGPSLDRAPQNDAPPVHWQPSNLDPLSVLDLDGNMLHFPPERVAGPRTAATSRNQGQGVLSEVFRPPCAKS